MLDVRENESDPTEFLRILQQSWLNPKARKMLQERKVE
jgi:hypothetical protein